MAGSARHRLFDINEVLIGRGPGRTFERADGKLTLKVPDGRVSSVHLLIHRERLGFVVEDAGAKNGVIVNRERVERRQLRDGDLIECGRTLFLYRAARSCPAGAPLDVDSADLTATEPGLVTFHEPLAQQLRLLEELAGSGLPIVVLGPSGTGKELVARAIHARSRRSGSFVGINCGALSENLVEAELFGARKGAFTGATEDRIGLVRSSDQGTLFLDEVGELPERAQTALLRVLQEHEILSVGSTRPVPVDLRLVTATHRDLEGLVRQGRFRADLLARLSGFTVRLPPLLDRMEDFGIVTAALLARHTQRDRKTPTISLDALRLLLSHSWPLNARELEHCLRAALVLSPERIEVAHLPESVRNPELAAPSSPAPIKPTRPLTVEEQARRDQLLTLLVEHGGSISAVARRLGKDRVQIRRWIKLYGIALDELKR